MDRLINMPSDYNLLIVEKSSSVLEQTGETKDYVLEGVFGEIDVKNKNIENIMNLFLGIS